MTMFDDRTVFEKLMGRPLPDYYDTMYLDGYKPWEIVEAAHNSIIKEAKARQAEREPQTPMNVRFQVEVKSK
ncbi:MAG: hypothetical protein MSO56_02875 [Clostridiales bacterium]|nr:hypothetical protein [Clostridiales bacterium]